MFSKSLNETRCFVKTVNGFFRQGPLAVLFRKASVSRELSLETPFFL